MKLAFNFHLNMVPENFDRTRNEKYVSFWKPVKFFENRIP